MERGKHHPKKKFFFGEMKYIRNTRALNRVVSYVEGFNMALLISWNSVLASFAIIHYC